MTQYFSYREFSLRAAPLHTRVLITAFSVVILVALCVGLVNYWDKTGMTPAGIASWYRGNEGQALSAGQSMTFEKTFRELLDATHPHLFGQGVLLFILAHFIALTGLRQRTKIAIYIVSFGAMLLDAAVPWLIRYVSADLAPLQIVSITLLTGAFVAQIVLPFREMWFMPPAAAAAASATAPQETRRDPVRRERRPQRDTFHRTGRAPSSEPAPARGRTRPRSPEDGPKDGSRSAESGERRGGNRRRRRGRRPAGRGPGTGATSENGSRATEPSAATND